ncbi:argininosuccinate synthase-related protein [Pseudothauera rhizosphaerae]|uniref:argininosuccinate synthase n=1 Tax=Pseudothauera rhizosphaerae TaxID=2565932 RepID=A0A4S4AC64_9RHOO|nr:argininosuccinate synthase-related protein [Pseudothauera rhizosphaerae]THF56236.1 argininosuccinate synthase [Pseudothauera rhizosphaerae]
MNGSRKIRSLDDLAIVADRCDHILTMFSGGLDSSYVLQALAGHRCRVTALSVDIGDGANRQDMAAIAEQFGVELHIVDAKREFSEDAVLPAIYANARYLGIYPISSSLSRPIIARQAVELAKALCCDAIVHTANQSHNSLRRLNGAIEQCGYKGYFGTPYEYTAISRTDKIEVLNRIGLSSFSARGISGDANLWCREFESGNLDDPEFFKVPDSLFSWTAERAEGEREISIVFSEGRPVEVTGEKMGLVDLIGYLNNAVGAFKIGRYCGLEHLEGGEKVLEVREAPAAHILMDAYRHLETATIDAELLRIKLGIEGLWVREAIEGRWFGATHRALSAFIAMTAREVSGEVVYRLRAGAADVRSIRALTPLYIRDRDKWEKTAALERASRSLHDYARSEGYQARVSILT